MEDENKMRDLSKLFLLEGYLFLMRFSAGSCIQNEMARTGNIMQVLSLKYISQVLSLIHL